MLDIWVSPRKASAFSVPSIRKECYNMYEIETLVFNIVAFKLKSTATRPDIKELTCSHRIHFLVAILCC